MDNHFHLVAAAEDLSVTIGALRRFTANAIIKQLKEDNRNWLLSELAFYKKKYKINSEFQVWQEGLHPILIQSQEMLNQKIEYGHFNPFHRGLVMRRNIGGIVQPGIISGIIRLFGLMSCRLDQTRNGVSRVSVFPNGVWEQAWEQASPPRSQAPVPLKHNPAIPVTN